MLENKKRCYDSNYFTKNEFHISQKKFQFEIENLIPSISNMGLMSNKSNEELEKLKTLLLLFKGDVATIIKLSKDDWKRYLSYYFQFVNPEFKHQALKHHLRE